MGQNYNYVDINVWSKVADGTYTNITMYSSGDTDFEVKKFPYSSDFLIEIPKMFNKDRLVYGATLADLVKIANVRDKEFLRRMSRKNSDLLAIYLARQMLDDYHGSIVISEEDDSIHFYKETSLVQGVKRRSRKKEVMSLERA